MDRRCAAFALTLLLFPLAAASAPAQPAVEPLDQELKQAETEQAVAEAQAARLEGVAARARGDASRLHAERAAAAQGIDAAEARIGAADVRLRLASAQVAAFRQRLAAEQQPVSSLLAGLATMARRPPLLVLADSGGTDELVRVRSAAQLDAARDPRSHGKPFRPARRRAAIARERVHGARRAARSRDGLVRKRQQYALLEEKALQQALASGGQALARAMSRSPPERTSSGFTFSSRMVSRSAPSPTNLRHPIPRRPARSPDEGSGRRPPFAYQLPPRPPVTEGSCLG